MTELCFCGNQVLDVAASLSGLDRREPARAARLDLLFKATDYYAPEHACTIAWSDPDAATDSPIEGAPTHSAKHEAVMRLRDAEVFP